MKVLALVGVRLGERQKRLDSLCHQGGAAAGFMEPVGARGEPRNLVLAGVEQDENGDVQGAALRWEVAP